jgi:hypothetical protein
MGVSLEILITRRTDRSSFRAVALPLPQNLGRCSRLASKIRLKGSSMEPNPKKGIPGVAGRPRLEPGHVRPAVATILPSRLRVYLSPRMFFEYPQN